MFLNKTSQLRTSEKHPVPTVNSSSQESVPSKTRRQFTASEKLRLVKAAEVALASGERGALEAMLRAEGICSSQLAEVDAMQLAMLLDGIDVRPSKRRRLAA